MENGNGEIAQTFSLRECRKQAITYTCKVFENKKIKKFTFGFFQNPLIEWIILVYRTYGYVAFVSR